VTAAIELRQVSVRHNGSKPVVQDVSLTLKEGERVALLGLNGSGKTSLLLAAAGLIPHEGDILIRGEKLIARNAATLRENLGVVFAVPEDQLLFPLVFEDVAFGHVRQGMTPELAKERARDTLDALGALALADRTPFELSHGERLRVAIAGALTTTPKVLLLDEPSSGLDPPGRRNLARVLAELSSAMWIATHDLDFARRCCDRYALLDGGVLRAQGDIEDVDSLWAE
jgi:cobalt/nickel transport system ATP-binding protein